MRLLSTLALVTSSRRCHRPCRALAATPSVSPTIHGSFADIANQYDAFILDQFGVLHNGVAALEGAIETVEYLLEKKKKLIILSNTSAPAHKVRKLIRWRLSEGYFLHAPMLESEEMYDKRLLSSKQTSAH